MKSRKAEEIQVATMTIRGLDEMSAYEVQEVRNWLYAQADSLANPLQYGKRYVARKWLWRVKEDERK